MRSVSRAKDQSIAIGRETLVSLVRIDGGRARVGLRCPAGWDVEQIELAELKRDRDARPWRRPVEPIWQSLRDEPRGEAAASDERLTRFFELPANGALKIGPAIRVRVADVTPRVAVFEIDGVADDEIEEV